MVVGSSASSDVVEDEPRRRRRRRAASAAGRPWRRVARPASPVDLVVGEDDVDDRRARVCRSSASTWSARSKPGRSRRAGSRRCRRTSRRRRGRDGVADRGDEQDRQEAREQAAGPEDDDLGVGDRREGVLGGADAVGRSTRRARCPAVRMIATGRRRSIPSASPGMEGDRRRRDRHDLAADREDPVHPPDAVLEVAALDARSSRRSAGCRPRARPARRLGLDRPLGRLPGKRYRRSSLISGSASARAAMQLRMSPTGGIPSSCPQDARGPAVVGDRDDRGEIARVLLEPAQERRQPGPAADRHDPRAARQEPLLVDDLDERLVGLGRRAAGR